MHYNTVRVSQEIVSCNSVINRDQGNNCFTIIYRKNSSF